MQTCPHLQMVRVSALSSVLTSAAAFLDGEVIRSEPSLTQLCTSWTAAVAVPDRNMSPCRQLGLLRHALAAGRGVRQPQGRDAAVPAGRPGKAHGRSHAARLAPAAAAHHAALPELHRVPERCVPGRRLRGGAPADTWCVSLAK